MTKKMNKELRKEYKSGIVAIKNQSGSVTIFTFDAGIEFTKQQFLNVYQFGKGLYKD